MVANRNFVHFPSMNVRPNRPLIGVVTVEDGEAVVQYFADENDADAALAQRASGGRALAGVWADLVWDDTVADLDRIRHESKPTPPIEAL
jgi:hypothetical protein